MRLSHQERAESTDMSGLGVATRRLDQRIWLSTTLFEFARVVIEKYVVGAMASWVRRKA